jgi:hypothetical protein
MKSLTGSGDIPIRRQCFTEPSRAAGLPFVPGLEEDQSISLADHPELYFVTETNTGAFGARHLNLTVVEQIPARGLVLGQIMRLHDLNPASAGSSAFRIDLYNGGNVHELEDQVV